MIVPCRRSEKPSIDFSFSIYFIRISLYLQIWLPAASAQFDASPFHVTVPEVRRVEGPQLMEGHLDFVRALHTVLWDYPLQSKGLLCLVR